MRKLTSTVILALLIFFLCPTIVMADTMYIGKEQPSDLAELIDAYTKLQERVAVWGNERVDDPSKKETEELRNAVRLFLIQRMKDEQAKAENARNVIRWTNNSATITFWVAHVLLAFGLLAAAMEFYNARKIRSRSKRESVDFEIKLEGLAVKNSTYGILLLFVSLTFYFMYLKFVYPVVAV